MFDLVNLSCRLVVILAIFIGCDIYLLSKSDAMLLPNGIIFLPGFPNGLIKTILNLVISLFDVVKLLSFLLSKFCIILPLNKYRAEVDNTDILIKIRKIVRSINLESKRILKDYGVSIPQVLCLNFLKNAHDFRSTQKEIGRFLNLNPSTVTGILNRLESKGYVARVTRKDDKRKTSIILTSKSSALLNEIPPLMHERLSENLKTLSPKDAETINDALDLLINYLEIGNIDASPVITVEDEIINDQR